MLRACCYNHIQEHTIFPEHFGCSLHIEIACPIFKKLQYLVMIDSYIHKKYMNQIDKQLQVCIFF